jgi:hypothetical protein
MIIHPFSTRSPDVLVVLIAILKLDMNVSFEKKILDLFNAFQAEASVELLFLKCLEKINLHFKDADEFNCKEDAPFFTVQISDNSVKEARTNNVYFLCIVFDFFQLH